MQNNGNGSGSSLATVRFDLSTKLALLAALILEGDSEQELNRAIETAVKLNALCDAKAEQLKATHRK